MITTNPILPPIFERAPATAWRLRRRLADHYPDTTFRVLTKRGAHGADLHVSWTDGPPPEAVENLAALHARTVNGHPAEMTLWATPAGGLALVWPGAQRVVLERTDQNEGRGDA